MLLALAQLAPVVGDVEGNAAAVDAAARAAASAGASLLVGPEMGLLGYPPRDLLLRRGVAEACVAAAERLAAAHPGMTMLLGLPRPVTGGERPLANSVALCRGGRVEAFYDKRLLPTYDVFDEDRWFSPGSAPLVFSHQGTSFGVAVCEDLWQATDVTASRRYRGDPVAESVAAGAACLLVPSASPFVRGKHQLHGQHLSAVAARHGVSVVVVNQVGGNDDLVFDGGSSVVDRTGRAVAALPRFVACTEVLDPAAPLLAVVDRGPAWCDEREWYEAIVTGIRDWFARTGHREALIGLSGGIDSALVATLASAALGANAVHGVLMPGPWSSAHSVGDAVELSERLRLGSHTIMGIDRLFHEARAQMVHFPGKHDGVTEENLQSRLRGLQLMTLSNASGALVLVTGNKSEFAAGYATLYGDMCGGLAPIGDLLKTEVWRLARWINAEWRSLGFRAAPIPESSITKAPSAELRANQTDQDTLPPYEAFDRLVETLVAEEGTPEEAARSSGLTLKDAREWALRIDRAQYKRDQAPVILKLSPRAFGRGRSMPIAWRPWHAAPR